MMNSKGKFSSRFVDPVSGIIFVLIAALPLFVKQQYWMGVFIVALYYAMMAVAWNLLAGFGGQFSLAPAAFSLLGAYTPGVLHFHYGVSPAIGIPLGVVVAGLTGLLLGRLVLRMRGPYVSLTSVAFLHIVSIVIANSYNITRGDLGLTVPDLFGISRVGYFYVFLGALVAVQVLVYQLLRSRMGLFIQAIRDDELAAASRGVDIVRWKTIVFGISSAMCGLAGALYVHFIQLASPEIGTILQSGLVVTSVVVGGMATLPGPIIGAFLIQVAAEGLRAIGVQHMLVFALLVILSARFFQGGIWGLVERALRKPNQAPREPVVPGPVTGGSAKP